MDSDIAIEIQTLLDRHGAALELFANQWTRHGSDCVQEAFIRYSILKSRPSNQAAWLYRVVRNLAIDQGKSETSRKLRERDFGQQVWFQETDELEFEPAEIQTALEKLECEIREVIVARIWGGLSFSEIASVTQVVTSTVTRRFHRGLQELKQHLERVEF